MTDSRAAENPGNAEGPAELRAAAPAETAALPTAPAAPAMPTSPATPAMPTASATPTAPAGSAAPAGAKRVPKGPPGVRIGLWIVLFGYCVFGVGLELSRQEPRLWVFALRGVIGVIAVVNAVAVYTEIRNRGRS
jgi:hypothetical protein